MNLKILSLAQARSTKEKFSHIISVLEPSYHPHVPDLGIPRDSRLLLVCDDTTDPEADSWSPRPPTKAMVREGLEFAKNLPDDATLLVHCYAGISRSAAMAYAIMCQHSPHHNARAVLRQLVRLRPIAMPNALIVEYADDILQRGGQMSEAVFDFRLYPNKYASGSDWDV